MYLESYVAVIIASISTPSPLHINRSPYRAGGERHVGQKGLLVAPLATLTRIHRFLYHDARFTEVTETMLVTNHSADEVS